MKKSLVVILVLVLAVVLSSCLNYKAYDVPAEEENSDLLDEIAEIEKQLEDNNLVGEEVEVVEENVAISNLGEAGDLVVIEVDESEQVRLNAVITDPDNDKITHSFSPPLNDLGIWQTNYGDAGEYSITLTASDGVHTTEQEILLVVNRVNVAPVIESLRDLTHREGDSISLSPVVEDPNKDAVSIEISAPLTNGEWNTDHTSAGTYEIFVTASDGELESSSSFMLTIADVNELPIITGVADEITVEEGDTVRIEPEVSDLDGDPLVLTISEPVGDDGVWDTDYTNHGVYSVVITVDDGKDIVRKTVQLTVADINKPPVIVDVSLDAQ